MLKFLKIDLRNINYTVILLAVLPAASLIGSSISNITVVLINLFFLYEILRNNKIIFFNNKFFYGLILLWIVLLINLIFFSINFENSFSRSFGFLRFVILVFAIKFYIFGNNLKFQKFILNTWLITFLLISFDVIFEYFFGSNILGFKSGIPGRLVSFLDQEYKIGYIFSFLSLISFLVVFSIYKNSKYSLLKFYLLILIILILSFIIGERANFIKTFLMYFIFVFFVERKFFKMKYLITGVFCLLVSVLIIFAENSLSNKPMQKDHSYTYRFWTTFLKPFIINPIESLSDTNYGDHYKTGYIIFKDFKLTGVGLKNYRIIVYDENNKYNFNPSTHPHEKHLELLSELGLTGYVSFIFFFLYSIYSCIKNSLKDKNLFQIGGSLFFITNIIPLIPSGSLFSTYSSIYFWISFAFLISYYKK